MTVVVRRALGTAAATALLCTGAVACGGGSDKGTESDAQSHSQITRALTAAYEKTSEVKSAKVEMTMKMPSSPMASATGGGTMKMSGTMGWDPTVMDMTMSGSALAAGDGCAQGHPHGLAGRRDVHGHGAPRPPRTWTASAG